MSLRRKSSDDLTNVNRSFRQKKVTLVNLITGKEGLLEDDAAYKELIGQEDVIVLVVSPVRFALKRQMLTAYPETMLGRMFGDNMNKYTRPTEGGEFIIESVSPEIFRIILGYYMSGSVKVTYECNMGEVKEACDFFLIPFSTKTIISENLSSLMHELSNDGAKKKFEVFLEKDIVPEMASNAMAGERECHIVCLMDDDLVEWDPEYPPAVGEDQWTMIHSTEINRFLKYIENREIAKTVLQEKGLKKIRLGIEGFPTHKEKVKIKQSGKIQVIYYYVQRPFIVMSWEKEELRSRHVDFVNLPTTQPTVTDNTENRAEQPQVVPIAPDNLDIIVDEADQVRELRPGPEN